MNETKRVSRTLELPYTFVQKVIAEVHRDIVITVKLDEDNATPHQVQTYRTWKESYQKYYGLIYFANPEDTIVVESDFLILMQVYFRTDYSWRSYVWEVLGS